MKAKYASIGVRPSALNGSSSDDWLPLIPFACTVCATDFLLQYINAQYVSIKILPMDSCIQVSLSTKSTYRTK